MSMQDNYAAYRAMGWTSDEDECEEACGRLMSATSYVEGRLGHYCSRRCRDAAERGGYSDDEERAEERRQMGLVH